MKKYQFIAFLLLFTAFSCSDSETEKDDIYPSIDMSAKTASPQNCDIFYRGDTLIFQANFKDNNELGAFSLNLHNNFDHHTHSTDDVECELDAIKTAIKPLTQILSYEIPAGLQSYNAEIKIPIPTDIDTGDYHLIVHVTDKTGWQTTKGISLKIR